MDGPTKGTFGQGLTRDPTDHGRQHPAVRPASKADNIQAIAALVLVLAIIASVLYFAFLA